MNILKLTITLFCLIFMPHAYSIEILATCHASNGYGYNPERGLMPKGEGGWDEGKISKGSTTFIRDEDKTIGVIFVDVSEQTQPPSQFGGNVITLHDDTERLVVAVEYPHVTVEVYYLNHNDNLLLWNQIKYQAPIEKSVAFESKCNKG